MVSSELDAYKLYSREVYQVKLHCQEYTNEDILTFAQRAKTGDQEAREAILSCCLDSMIMLAVIYHVYVPRDDVGDLIGIANVTIVSCLDKALTRDRPVAYLIGCARNSLLKYINTRSSLIAKPAREQSCSLVSLQEVETWLTAPYARPKRKMSTKIVQLLLALATPEQREAILMRLELWGRNQQGLSSYQKNNLGKQAIRGCQRIYRYIHAHRHENPYCLFARYVEECPVQVIPTEEVQ